MTEFQHIKHIKKFLEQDNGIGSFFLQWIHHFNNTWTKSLCKKSRNYLRSSCTLGEHRSSCIGASRKIQDTLSPSSLPLTQYHLIRRKLPTPNFSWKKENLVQYIQLSNILGAAPDTGFYFIFLEVLMEPSILLMSGGSMRTKIVIWTSMHSPYSLFQVSAEQAKNLRFQMFLKRKIVRQCI